MLLDADREPQGPQEWDQWLAVIRTALRKQAVTTASERGRQNEHATLRLVRTHCFHRSHPRR